MARSRPRRLRPLVAAGLAVAALIGVPAAGATAGGAQPVERASRCERTFERAQRTDMESFRDYDVETWRAIHTDDAVSIFSDGTVLQGIDEIIDTLSGHFEGREAIWSWTEISRQVYGCESAYILYQTVYEIPSIDLRIDALTGVSYTYRRGKWLAFADQGTPNLP